LQPIDARALDERCRKVATLNAMGWRSVKIIGSGLFDAQEMRIGVAGLDENLKRLGAGKCDVKVLHRSSALPSCAKNIIRVEVKKEVKLVIRSLLVTEN
jgi:hypothetical protein